jgi:hypothetical protein
MFWGDQPIPKSIDEVANIDSISYDCKRKFIVKRTERKQKISVDSVLLCMFKEILFDAKKAKLSEILIVGVAILHATINISRTKEIEVEGM